MAVAEKPSTQKSRSAANPTMQLALASAAGTIYLLVCAGFLFSGLPVLWAAVVDPLLANPYLSSSLLVMASVCVLVGMVLLGLRLLKSVTIPGVKAGSVVGAVGVFVIFLLMLNVANQLALGSATHEPTEYFNFGETWHLITWGTAGAMALVLLAGLGFLYLKLGFSRWLVQFEGNGWFDVAGYKPTQGLKVRRGTFIGLLIVIGAGVFTFAQHGLFNALLLDPDFPSMPWAIFVPYSGGQSLFLLHQVPFTAPLLTFALLGWLSWRIVNYPPFADFLIATEAELNKVSWPTRRRLVQDTIVVLVTVVLLTAFLFVVDILWIRILSVPGVLQIDPKEAMAAQKADAGW